jgi:hypothetical protein
MSDIGNTNHLPVGTVIYRNKRLALMLFKKYGNHFLEDLEIIRNKPFYGLVYVAEKYGITRERVRQIHYRLYREKFGKVSVMKTAKIKKEIKLIGCPYDPRTKIANSTGQGYGRKGAEVEKKVFDKCKGFGLDVKIPQNNQVDLIVSGMGVEIKSCYKIFNPNPNPNKKYLQKYEKFSLSIKQHKNISFEMLILYSQIKKIFYVIPSPILRGKGSGIYIPLSRSNYHNSIYGTNWDIFIERWDLFDKNNYNYFIENFNGKKQKLSEINVNHKKCKKCLKIKQINLFYECTKKSDGHLSICKSCLSMARGVKKIKK